MINREPWIEVTGVEVDSGSLADHQQQGRHSAQLETRGRAKKQRRSLKSSAEEGEHLIPHRGLFRTQFPAFASILDIFCVSWPLSFMLSQLAHERRDVSQVSRRIHFACCDSSQQSINANIISLAFSSPTTIGSPGCFIAVAQFLYLK